LKNLKAENANQQEISKKLNHAKMHTTPIKELIHHLNYKTTEIKNEIVVIKGQNQKGTYQIEFPSFVLEQSKEIKLAAKNYVKTVSLVAGKIETELMARDQ